MLGLAFSGGKDSLACWYLHRHENPIVLWVNTGKAYPETVAIVDEIRAQAFRFVEVRSNQQAQIDANGLPSELVPIDWTTLGMVFTSPKTIKVQSYLGCCYENISAPLMAAAKANGVTVLIRGQRIDEGHKAPSRDGDIVEGIVFRHPIEGWSKEEVLAYVLECRGALPAHFSIEHSSLDCYDCTAYSGKSADRIRWMRSEHPDLYDKYAKSKTALNAAIMEAFNA